MPVVIVGGGWPARTPDHDVLARLALGRDALPSLWRDLRFDRPALAGS
jgi:hypothetical protein